MLSVAANWLVLMASAYVTGAVFLSFWKSRTAFSGPDHAPVSMVSSCMAGLVILTVYAQTVSLFTGVGLFAFLPLLAVTLIGAVLLALRHSLILRDRQSCSAGYTAGCVLLFFVMAYATSHGISHYDTALYHAQAIRWAETYGAVKGLGNLHVRLAYNSAAFPLSALFSFSFLFSGGSSMHAVQGVLAYLLAVACLPLVRFLQKPQFPGGAVRAFGFADAARLVALYWLCNVFDEINSPASDYFVTAVLLFLVIRWCETAERPFVSTGQTQDAWSQANVSDRMHQYALLCVLAVYAVTLKLSAAPFLLLTALPVTAFFLQLHPDRRAAVKILAEYLLAGFLVALPFLLRNVLLSGWLVYPFPAIDLFDVVWKIPKETALADAAEIRAYGRGFTDVSGAYAAFSAWFPVWQKGLGRVNLLCLLLALAGFPLAVYDAVSAWKRSGRQKDGARGGAEARKQDTVSGEDGAETFQLTKGIPGAVCVLLLTMYAALLFWFVSAPLIRYGAFFLWLPAVFTGCRAVLYDGRGNRRFPPNRLPQTLFVCAAACYFGMRFILLAAEDIPRFRTEMLLRQQPYEQFATVPYAYTDDGWVRADAPLTADAPTEADEMPDAAAEKANRETSPDPQGIRIGIPAEGDRTGYTPFPTAPYPPACRPAGNTLREGFLP